MRGLRWLAAGSHVLDLAAGQGRHARAAEALGMAVQMGGGPALMYAAKALDSYDELSAALAPKAAE